MKILFLGSTPLGFTEDEIVCYPTESVDKVIENSPYDLIIGEESNLDYKEVLDELQFLQAQPLPVFGINKKVYDFLGKNRKEVTSLFSDLGFQTPAYLEVQGLVEALDTVKKTSAFNHYRIKIQVGNAENIIVYSKEEGIAVLEWLGRGLDPKAYEQVYVAVEEYVQGYELSIGAFFNGYQFVHPFQYVIEYKELGENDFGLSLGTTGTHLVSPRVYNRYYMDNAYLPCLTSFVPLLESLGYVGYFRCQFVIPTETAIPERTRTIPLWTPIAKNDPVVLDIHFEHPQSIWSSLFLQMVDGRKFISNLMLKNKPDWSPPVHILASSVYPLGYPLSLDSLEEFPVLGLNGLAQGRSALPVGVVWDGILGDWRIASGSGGGEICTVLAYGDDLEVACTDLVSRLRSLRCPFISARTDIGLRTLPSFIYPYIT